MLKMSKHTETSDIHLQAIMKNGFPIKNFEDLIDQVRNMN